MRHRQHCNFNFEKLLLETKVVTSEETTPHCPGTLNKQTNNKESLYNHHDQEGLHPPSTPRINTVN
jgi:hypothetical protein